MCAHNTTHSPISKRLYILCVRLTLKKYRSLSRISLLTINETLNISKKGEFYWGKYKQLFRGTIIGQNVRLILHQYRLNAGQTKPSINEKYIYQFALIIISYHNLSRINFNLYHRYKIVRRKKSTKFPPLHSINNSIFLWFSDIQLITFKN